jgi:hypothetical protein
VEIEFDRWNYEDGRFGLLFTPPSLGAFRDLGLSGSGQDWERLLVRVLPRVAPGALADTEFDCESDLFVAINSNPAKLSELEAAITELVRDERALRAFVKELARGA